MSNNTSFELKEIKKKSEKKKKEDDGDVLPSYDVIFNEQHDAQGNLLFFFEMMMM